MYICIYAYKQEYYIFWYVFFFFEVFKYKNCRKCNVYIYNNFFNSHEHFLKQKRIFIPIRRLILQMERKIILTLFLFHMFFFIKLMAHNSLYNRQILREIVCIYVCDFNFVSISCGLKFHLTIAKSFLTFNALQFFGYEIYLCRHFFSYVCAQFTTN